MSTLIVCYDKIILIWKEENKNTLIKNYMIPLSSMCTWYFKCFICKKDHSMPEEGLLINKRLLRILALKPKEVSRGEKVKKLNISLTSRNKIISLKY